MLLAHLPNGIFGTQESPFQIDPQDKIPILLRGLGNCLLDLDARIIDENIHSAEMATCRDLYTGFLERLKKYPEMDLVGAPLGVPFCDKTFDAVTDLLTAHHDLDGIYVFGGPSVLCAVKAAQAR